MNSAAKWRGAARIGPAWAAFLGAAGDNGLHSRHAIQAFAGPHAVLADAGALAGLFAIPPVHLAFQHANIDYTLGPAPRLLGVAEMRRWHHKRDYEEAQVNFGEVFLVWNWLFGSLHDASAKIESWDLGLSDATYPKGFFAQHAAPFDPRR